MIDVERKIQKSHKSIKEAIETSVSHVEDEKAKEDMAISNLGGLYVQNNLQLSHSLPKNVRIDYLLTQIGVLKELVYYLANQGEAGDESNSGKNRNNKTEDKVN